MLVLCMICCVSSLHAKEKMRIAVLDLKARGISRATSAAISNLLRSDIVDTGLFTVVERSQMNEILREQGLQMTGCTDSSCAVEVGKLLSARKILIGEVARIGASTIITVRIVDVEKGVAEFASKAQAATSRDLNRASEQLSRKLAERITGKKPSQWGEVKTARGYYMRSILPGWGQSYAGSSTKGLVYAGAFIAAAAFAGYAVYDFEQKKQEYSDLALFTPASTFDEKYDAKKKAGNIAAVAVSLASAVYIMNWVDALFITPHDFSSGMARTDEDGKVYVSLYRSCDHTGGMLCMSAGMRF